MSRSSTAATGFSWARWTLGAGLLGGLPVVLAMAGLLFLREEEAHRQKVRAEQALEQVLSSLEPAAHPLQFHTRFLRQLEQHLFKTPGVWPDRVPTVLHGVRKRFPGVYSFTFVDRNGQPIPELCDAPPPRFLIQRFVDHYRRLIAGQPHDLAAQRTFIAAFLGPLAPIDRPWHGRVLPVHPSGERPFLYLSAPHDQGMMIVHLSHEGGLPRLPLLDLFRRAARRHPEFNLRLKDGTTPALSAPSQPRPRALGLATRPASRVPPVSPSGLTWQGPVLLARRDLTPRFRVEARFRLPDRPGSTSRAVAFGMRLLLFLWALLAIGLWLVMHGVPPLTLGIRQTLILSLGYTAAIPLLIMGAAAWRELANRRQVLETDLHDRAEALLRSLDARFPRMIQQIESTIDDLFREGGTVEAWRAQGGRRFFTTLHTRFGWNLLRLIDRQGRLVFEHRPPQTWAVDRENLGLFTRAAMSILANLREEEAPATRAGLEEAMGFILSRATSDLGKIRFYEMNLSRLFLTLVPLFTRDQHAELLAVMLWSQELLEWTYLQKHLLSAARTLTDTELFAYHRLQPELSLPMSPQARRRQAFASRIRSAFHSLRAKEEEPGGAVLLTGMRGSELTAYDLVAVSGDRLIRAEIQQIAWQYGLAGLLFLLISMTVGSVVAQAFLVPIGELTAGVQAVQRRIFTHRLQISQPDEFGALAEAFNRMLEEMADLEVARIVQEQLFPRGPLTHGAWEVAGTCRTATQVGGDCFDYAVLDDDRLLVVIGDVSGHGVAAALVVGMAKAILGHPARPEAPAAMLDLMNAVLYRLLQKRRVMTCQIAIFDQRSLTLTMANSGHPFPLQIGPSGATTLRCPSSPLGLRPTLRGSGDVTFPWAADQSLLLYSDGLVEAPMANGESIGYHRLEAVASQLVRPGAAATMQAVLAWHDGLAAWDPPGDDVTVVVVQQRRQAPGPATRTTA